MTTRPKVIIRPVDWVACYAAWIVLCGIAGLSVQYWLGLMTKVGLAVRANQWVAYAFRELSLPILGLLWIILIFWLEHYLRHGVQTGRLWPRIARATAGIGGFILVIVVLYQVL